MPPKAKITKEMVIDAAFEVARTQGAEKINARTVSQKLGCSTQPVMYHFAKIEDMKRAAYQKADRFHTEYLMNAGQQENPMLGIGVNYIRFAVQEPHLFRFLFQSGYVAENSLTEMINSKELEPVIAVMQKAMGLNMKETKNTFVILAMFVHGYASLIVNNALDYEEEMMKKHLARAFRAAVSAAGEEIK